MLTIQLSHMTHDDKFVALPKNRTPQPDRDFDAEILFVTLQCVACNSKCDLVHKTLDPELV